MKSAPKAQTMTRSSMVLSASRRTRSSTVYPAHITKGTRITSTMKSRPTVASPGAMSLRTARATIQFPDHSMSVAMRMSQAVKRGAGRLSPAC